MCCVGDVFSSLILLNQISVGEYLDVEPRGCLSCYLSLFLNITSFGKFKRYLL